MPTEKPRYCITVDDETLKEIDDFRFENRYNSRSKATLELIRMGLESLKTNEKDNLKKEKFYDKPYAEMYRQIIRTGLECVQKSKTS